MPTIDPLVFRIVVSFGILHLICIIVNYGLVYAFLQRRNIDTARTYFLRHMGVAALYSLGGVFCTLDIISTTSFPKFGIKFLPFETPLLTAKWFLKEIEHLENEEREAEEMRRISNKTEGRCKSIW